MAGLVSIIMPSFNTAKYIGKSIESVLMQSYTNWELIIIDDCSQDDFDSAISKYLSDSRIRILKNDINMGAAESRNRGLREAKGQWIAFLDSDDLWDREKLEKQINFMETNGYSFSYTKYKEIDVEGEDAGVTVSGPKAFGRIGIKNYCWPGCLTVMYKADEIGLLQIPNIQKNNDYAMWLKVSQNSKCYLLNEVLASYRRGRGGSISNHGWLKLLKWHYVLFKLVEGQNSFWAGINTIRNMFFGVIKKVFYVKRG